MTRTRAAGLYGPIAAFLVEAFPAKVRYTSFSLPYHLGNGVFVGLLPLIGLYVNSATKSMYWGFAYPIIVASITFVVGMIALKETRRVRIWDELEAVRPSSLHRPAPGPDRGDHLPPDYFGVRILAPCHFDTGGGRRSGKVAWSNW